MFTCKIHLFTALRGSGICLDELLQAFVVNVVRCPLGHLITWQAVSSQSQISVPGVTGRHGAWHCLAFHSVLLSKLHIGGLVKVGSCAACADQGMPWRVDLCGGESNGRYLYHRAEDRF